MRILGEVQMAGGHFAGPQRENVEPPDAETTGGPLTRRWGCPRLGLLPHHPIAGFVVLIIAAVTVLMIGGAMVLIITGVEDDWRICSGDQ